MAYAFFSSFLLNVTCTTRRIHCHAAAIAVQKVIAAENLLENGRQSGKYLARLVSERLQSPGALAQPFTFDVRGGGIWAVEFDSSGPEYRRLDLKGERLAMVVQARCLASKRLIVMGMTGGANMKGGSIIFGPGYNISREELRYLGRAWRECWWWSHCQARCTVMDGQTGATSGDWPPSTLHL